MVAVCFEAVNVTGASTNPDAIFFNHRLGKSRCDRIFPEALPCFCVEADNMVKALCGGWGAFDVVLAMEANGIVFISCKGCIAVAVVDVAYDPIGVNLRQKL